MSVSLEDQIGPNKGRTIRSAEEEHLGMPEERLSPKQASMEEESKKNRGKNLRLFRHSPLGFSYLVTSGKERYWMPYSTLRCLPLSSDNLKTSPSIDCKSLVRFWYPPTMNEYHVTKYGFLLVV